jgi:hypothetical protein
MRSPLALLALHQIHMVKIHPHLRQYGVWQAQVVLMSCYVVHLLWCPLKFGILHVYKRNSRAAAQQVAELFHQHVAPAAGQLRMQVRG